MRRNERRGGDAPLDDAARQTILEAAHEMAGDGLRVLAIAGKNGASVDDAETGMAFLGLVGLSDPPSARGEAAAIRTCEEAGIRVVMITGDHPVTALSIARELGLPQTNRVVTGAELESMSDAELEREVEHIGVFARVSPADKLRVVEALQQREATWSR